YDLGLVVQRIAPLDQIDAIVGNREALTLAQEIADHAITLVRDDAKLMPASKLPADARIFNLAITNGEDRLSVAETFVAAMRGANHPVETVVLDERSTETEVQKAIEHAQGANLVIASLYGRVRSGQSNSVGLPEPGARALTALLNRKAPVIGISFGNPYLLQSFPNMHTYLVAYGDMPSLQRAAASAVLGEIDVTGKLPITLPSLYERGSGIQLKAVNAGSREKATSK
ncbi:MAG: hypothetical protein H0T92_19390, partial [Pyrinomonadaceae bacterium]|nr:hypothetical protein [Pyrinomonadaceae bacterium]